MLLNSTVGYKRVGLIIIILIQRLQMAFNDSRMS